MNIIFYSTPAFGHINPSLALCSAVAQRHHLTVYSSSEFEFVFNGVCENFIPYDFSNISFDMTIGDKLIDLSELLLRFTVQNIDSFLSDALKLSPDVIIYDTLALWGRSVGMILNQKRKLKTVSINAFSAVHSKRTKAFGMYMASISPALIRQLGSLSSVMQSRKVLRNQYGVEPVDFMSVIMNPADYNVYTYPQCLHPDGFTLADNYFFLGPTACKRDTYQVENYPFDNIIYVSLGTIFNNNDAFWRAVIDQFGNTKYNVIMACMDKADKYRAISDCDNIHIYEYVNQRAVLSSAKAFISCGGMNSICEAASFGVPCVLYPQQSEQNMNATMFARNGFGVKIKHISSLYNVTDDLINKYHVDEQKNNCFKQTYIREFVNLIEK